MTVHNCRALSRVKLNIRSATVYATTERIIHSPPPFTCADSFSTEALMPWWNYIRHVQLFRLFDFISQFDAVDSRATGTWRLASAEILNIFFHLHLGRLKYSKQLLGRSSEIWFKPRLRISFMNLIYELLAVETRMCETKIPATSYETTTASSIEQLLIIGRICVTAARFWFHFALEFTSSVLRSLRIKNIIERHENLFCFCFSLW